MSGGSPIDNLVDAVVDPVKDAGSWIDDKVREEVPAGWLGVAALVGGAYLGAEAIAAGNAAESAALAQGATAAEAAAAGAEAATAVEATSGGFGISSGTAPVGLNPAIGSGVGASSGIGIDTGLASGGYLGAGAASDAAATSGLGYLGGAEALPTGTAGLATSVATEAPISPLNAVRGANLANMLLARQPTATGMPRQQIRPAGSVDYSGVLSLLEQKTKRPNIISLLG